MSAIIPDLALINTESEELQYGRVLMCLRNLRRRNRQIHGVARNWAICVRECSRMREWSLLRTSADVAEERHGAGRYGSRTDREHERTCDVLETGVSGINHAS